MHSPIRRELESKLQTLIGQAWDGEVRWPEVEAWIENFSGKVLARDDEELYCLFALTRFIYFSKRLVREMLKSLYRDHFETILLQRVRRNLSDTKDAQLLRKMYSQELSATRFIGIGNPAESGAHLLYYFRQVNHLQKDLFVDFHGAFAPIADKAGDLVYRPRDGGVSRYVFFDDIVCSGTQVSAYLTNAFSRIVRSPNKLELRFLSLFATTGALDRLNRPELFDGKAVSLFELDESFKAFHASSRYFAHAPSWFKRHTLLDLAKGYGELLQPTQPLGYKDGQLLLGFTHNTPDNTLPIFWDEGWHSPWSAIFRRYDKNYGTP